MSASRFASRSRLSVLIGGVVACSIARPASAMAQDPLDVGSGAVFRLTADSVYQEGCLPPCLCPIWLVQDISGTLKLTPDNPTDPGMVAYGVQDVNILVRRHDGPTLITGFGRYEIGSPGPTTVLQHRMRLSLLIGDTEPQLFDSGWVPITQNGRINIALAINGFYCWDIVLLIDADRVPDHEIIPYMVLRDSSFQRGCWDPCDCPIGPQHTMVGTFDLVPLGVTPNWVAQYAVVNAQWQVALDATGNTTTPICGAGWYAEGGEFAIDKQWIMMLTIGDEPPTLFDSGLITAPSYFPLIDMIMSMNGFVCFDTALHVVAEPAPPQVCGGIAGIPCSEGEFCKLGAGHCCCDFMGVCVPTGGFCPAVWDPVCGCDGVTYGNECEADAAGMSIDHYGPCQEFCFLDPDCPDPSYFCKFPAGGCGDVVMGGGFCTQRPTGGCPEIYDPVCGCDGVTYGNECESDAAGISLRHHGECERTCGRASDPPCLDNEFCKYPIGRCDDATAVGVCIVRPELCPRYSDPVCGCDGITYGNPCEADAAGVALLHWGPCAPPMCAALRRLSEPPSTFCPGVAKRVQIVLTIGDATSAFSLEDMPPTGWTVGDISHNGVFDDVNGKIKWGPFFAPFPTEVSYSVRPGPATDVQLCFHGEISIDGVNQTVCGVDCLSGFCPPLMGADLPGPPCIDCDVSDCTACGENGCGDGQITMCELVAFACAWKTGCHDDMSGMTRAAFVWHNGECYCWDDAADNWFAAACPPPASSFCSDPATAGSPPPGILSDAEVTTQRRPARDSTTRAPAYDVWIELEIPPEASAVAVEVLLPKGWSVAAISDDGAWDPVNRKVKWGLFTNSLSRTVQLTVIPPDDSRLAHRKPGKRLDSWSAMIGAFSVDGYDRPFAVR